MKVLRALSVIVLLTIAFLQTNLKGVEAQSTNSVYVTYYIETNGQGWPYRGVIACDYSFPKNTLVRILGTDYGTYDEFTKSNDLYVCQDHYATYLGFRFDVWKINDGVNITGVYQYQILGVV